AERREHGALDRVVEVGVAHDDERVLAAQLQRRVQQVAPRDLAYAPAHRRAARERELVEALLVHHVDEELAGRPGSAAEDDVEHARRHAGLLEELRSEEHTSELQSRENLVCRLLLEKKKNREQIQ